MEIGSIIKNARNNTGLTQEQAAEALYVSRQTISNWENGKTYPDIISVIKMSDLYAVSLDHLLKEETSVKQTYKEFLEESTNTVRSGEKKSKLILTLTTLGIWALSVIAFWLTEGGAELEGISTSLGWGVLPVLFFTVSFIMGRRDYFGRLKWLAAPVFGIMYSFSGSIVSRETEAMVLKVVKWPDFTKLPVGMLIALAGLGAGILVSRRKSGKTREE